MKEKLPFYSFNPIMSRDAVINIICGLRGLGKTYGAKTRAIRNALTKGEQLIYLRRFDSELDGRYTFFADVVKEEEFPDYDFRVIGYEMHASHIDGREHKKREWVTIGYFVALTKAQTLKGVSYANVTVIIFDEFLIESQHHQYLRKEYHVLLNFYSTVDRNQDRVKLIMLSNSITIDNPYFSRFKVRPESGQEWYKREKGFVVFHFPKAEDFQQAVYKTRWGKFIKGSEFADFAVGNVFGDNHDHLIMPKHPKATYQFTLEMETGRFAVWHHFHNDVYYVESSLPKQQMVYTMVAKNMSEEKMLLTGSDPLVKQMKSYFRHGKIFFDKHHTRNNFIGVFT